MRDATFTASPIAVYSRRCGEPMSPTITGPLWMPIPSRSAARAPRCALAIQVGQPLLHRERAAHRALGMIGLRHRRPEVRHDPVADELVERAAEREDLLDHAGVALVQQRDHVLARQRLAEGGEVADVAEEDRHLAPLAGAARPDVLETRRDLRREVAAEALAPPLLVRDARHQVDHAPAEVHARERRRARAE